MWSIYLIFSINSITASSVLTQFRENDFQLKPPPDNTTRSARIFSFFSDDPPQHEDDDEEEAISADPALYWAKLKRNSLRKKAGGKGALKGSFTTNKGIVTSYPRQPVKNNFLSPKVVRAGSVFLRITRPIGLQTP